MSSVRFWGMPPWGNDVRRACMIDRGDEAQGSCMESLRSSRSISPGKDVPESPVSDGLFILGARVAHVFRVDSVSLITIKVIGEVRVTSLVQNDAC
jgi:hypothetical protein